MRRVDAWFKDYGASHQTKGNKLTHLVGIPLIIMTLLGLLHPLTLFHAGNFAVPAAMMLWVLGTAFYVWIHPVLGASMFFSVGVLYYVGTVLPRPALWTLFAAGWIFQFAGHYFYEKKMPAFTRNLAHLLVGPLYIQNSVLKIKK